MIAQNMGFVNPRMMHSTAQLSLPIDNTLRHQLEDMARRGQRISSLPPVPELSTPNECSLVESTPAENSLNIITAPNNNDSTPTPSLFLSSVSIGANNPMNTSLFQEFSNRQLRQES